MTDDFNAPQTPDLVRHAERFPEKYQPYDTPKPRRKVTVVTCMDARLDLFGLFGLDIGDAHLIRNAGGVVTDDVIRSLAISQRKLGTNEILLVHHTDCGQLTYSDDELRDELLAETGYKPPWTPESFSDLESDLKQSMRRVLASPFLPNKQLVRGFIFEVETGRLREVEL